VSLEIQWEGGKEEKEGVRRTVYIGHHIAGLWVLRGECVQYGVARHRRGAGLGHALLKVLGAGTDVPIQFIDLRGSRVVKGRE